MSNTHDNGSTPVARALEMDREESVSFWRPRNLVIIALLVIAIVTAIRLTGGDPATQYQTALVERKELLIYVTATGALEPTNKVDVGIEVSGTIASVEVDYNDRVETGQVLARLDTTKLSAQVLQARATLESARARLLIARARLTEASNEFDRLQRVRELSGGKVPSQSELDRAEAATLSARADETAAHAAIAEAEARLEVNETDLSKAIIRAPISGIVLNRTVDPGQTVAASLQTPVLFTLAEDLQQMELRVDVDEADVGRVTAGQQATFSVDAYPERDFPAQIKEVRFAPKTVEGVVTYETILTVDNGDLALRPGMTATADILVQRLTDVLLAPNAALRFTPLPENIDTGDRGSSPQASGSPVDQVWRLENGKPMAITVNAGASDGEMTEIGEATIGVGTPLIVRRLPTPQ